MVYNGLHLAVLLYAYMTMWTIFFSSPKKSYAVSYKYTLFLTRKDTVFDTV